MSKKTDSKKYTTKTAEEKKAFERINPMVDTSKQSLEDSLAKQLNQTAIDKSFEQGGISNADFYQNAGPLVSPPAPTTQSRGFFTWTMGSGGSGGSRGSNS